ncbi:MAG: glycosyltransferase [Mycobacteriales bacterium]
MRVLHLTSSFPRSADDHVAPFLLDLARAQVQAGLDVAVLAPHDPGAPRYERLDGVHVHRFRYGPDRAERLAYRGGLVGRARTTGGLLALPLFLLAFTLAALRLTRRLRPDVLHAHWWLPAGLCALLASRVTNTPLVLTLHGSDVHLLRHRPVRWVGSAVLSRAAVLAVVSEDLRRTLGQLLDLPAERVRVLRMPVAGMPVAGRVSCPAAPPLRLLAAGRLSPEKGFDVLLAALALAVADGLDATLELVGSGPEHDRLARLAAPLGGRVRLLPAEPRAQLWRRMEQAHVVVVPSRREGLGLVALEALAHGRPVIASRVGGLPDVVLDESDGLLVRADDAQALADALQAFSGAAPGAQPGGDRPVPPPAVRTSAVRSSAVPTGHALAGHAPEHVARTHLVVYATFVHCPR